MYKNYTVLLKTFSGSIDLIFLPPDPANFSASPPSGKTKNVNFIKLAKKRHPAKRKWHPSFVVLRPIFFKLVSMDAELNSALGNEKYFYQIIRCGT